MKSRKNHKPHGFVEREEAFLQHDPAGTWLRNYAETKKKKHSQKQRFHKNLHHKDKTVIIPGNGELCPRCKRPMQIRGHGVITEKLLKKPYYYNRWYCCMYPDCKTTIVHKDQFKVAKPVVWGESWDADKPDSNERPPWEDEDHG